jgi:hypothetical protein
MTKVRNMADAPPELKVFLLLFLQEKKILLFLKKRSKKTFISCAASTFLKSGGGFRIHTENADFLREKAKFLESQPQAGMLGVAVDIAQELCREKLAAHHVAFQLRHVHAVRREAA